jgi:glycosyltransferase involved in cell wall biosynthesis
MAAGVPVLTAGHGAFPEILDGERAGLLTDEDMAGLPAGTAIP